MKKKTTNIHINMNQKITKIINNPILRKYNDNSQKLTYQKTYKNNHINFQNKKEEKIKNL